MKTVLLNVILFLFYIVSVINLVNPKKGIHLMKKYYRVNRIFTGIFLSFILLSARTFTVNAAYTTNVNLGDASSFAVLAGSAITNTGTTNVSGTAGNNIGVYPGTSITESAGPIILTTGTKYSNSEQIVLDAKNALTAAYVDIQGRSTTSVIVEELGGATLVPGVYSSDAGYFGLTGTVTLDAENDPNAVFIFKMNSTLTTAGASTVLLINGADPCRIFWQVGSSATLGTSSTFSGHILASDSITATTSATINGSLLAQTGAVTLDTNTIVNNACLATASTLVIIKDVINNNSGTSIASDFLINVTYNGVDVTGSPANGSNVGVSYTLTPGVYVVSEPAHSGYGMIFTGDIQSNGTVTLASGETKTIHVVNNDIAPAGEAPTTLPTPLPRTFSNQGILILLGGATALIGVVGWYVKRKS